jgi:hypothetical protein
MLRKISLAARIRDKIDAGLLPRRAPKKMRAGYGQGNPCHGCDAPILPAQAEYEARIDPDSEHPFRFHTGCLGIWLGELHRHRDRDRALADLLVQAVRRYFPYARCFSCLARDLRVTEAEVRGAAQALVVDDRLRAIRRICYTCSRTGETLGPVSDPKD